MIVALEAGSECRGVPLHVLADRRGEPLMDERLDQPEAVGRTDGDRVRQLHRSRQEVVTRYDVEHVSEARRLVGVDHLARVQQLQGGLDPDDPRQQPRAGAGVGHQATVHEVPCESSLVAGQARSH